MSSAEIDVIERSESTWYDRSCSILLLDDLVFCPMEFYKNKSKASNQKILVVHTDRRPRTKTLFRKGTVRRDEKFLQRVMKLRIQAHHCCEESMNRARLPTAHAAILNGGAWEKRYTDTVRKIAPHKGQRLLSQFGNICNSSSWAWGSCVNGLYSGCPSWARA